MRRHQQLPSCTGDHFTAAVTTTPAPAATSLQKQLPVLNQRSPSCTSRYQQPPVLHQQLPVLNQQPPSCTSDHLPAPVDISGYQFCTSNYQSWTSDYLPAPADISSYQFCTSNYQSWPSDHFPAPADTSPALETIFLHQRKPVLHQRPPIQWIPVLYQLSRPAPMITIWPWRLFAIRFFWFTIRHNKVWPFEATSLFCHSCRIHCQSLIFQKFAGTGIFIWPPQQVYQPLIGYLNQGLELSSPDAV